MNKQELIDKLKQHGAWCTEFHDTHGKIDKYVKVAKVIELLDQLDEPQDEKVEVPDFVAELIRKYKAKKETLFSSIANIRMESDEYKWYVDNAEIYERAWVNGYTVKPKRWVVKLPDDYYFCSWVSLYSIEASGVTYKLYDDVFVFDDRKKAEAVATLVDGTVEEL